MGLTIKPKKDCRWDLVSLGEVMVRLDPGERRIATTHWCAGWNTMAWAVRHAMASILRSAASACARRWEVTIAGTRPSRS